MFFSIQGHRMNQVMKTLTIVATIFIPLTLLWGIFFKSGIFALFAKLCLREVAKVKNIINNVIHGLS